METWTISLWGPHLIRVYMEIENPETRNQGATTSLVVPWSQGPRIWDRCVSREQLPSLWKGKISQHWHAGRWEWIIHSSLSPWKDQEWVGWPSGQKKILAVAFQHLSIHSITEKLFWLGESVLGILVLFLVFFFFGFFFSFFFWPWNLHWPRNLS